MTQAVKRLKATAGAGGISTAEVIAWASAVKKILPGYGYLKPHGANATLMVTAIIASSKEFDKAIERAKAAGFVLDEKVPAGLIFRKGFLGASFLGDPEAGKFNIIVSHKGLS